MVLKQERIGDNLYIYNGDTKIGSIYYCYTKKTVVFENLNQDVNFEEYELLEIAGIIKEEKKQYWGGMLP